MIGLCKPLSQDHKDSLFRIFTDYNRILYFEADGEYFCVPFNEGKNRTHAFDVLKKSVKKTFSHYVSCEWLDVNCIVRNRGNIK